MRTLLLILILLLPQLLCAQQSTKGGSGGGGTTINNNYNYYTNNNPFIGCSLTIIASQGGLTQSNFHVIDTLSSVVDTDSMNASTGIVIHTTGKYLVGGKITLGSSTGGTLFLDVLQNTNQIVLAATRASTNVQNTFGGEVILNCASNDTLVFRAWHDTASNESLTGDTSRTKWLELHAVLLNTATNLFKTVAANYSPAQLKVANVAGNDTLYIADSTALTNISLQGHITAGLYTIIDQYGNGYGLSNTFNNRLWLQYDEANDTLYWNSQNAQITATNGAGLGAGYGDITMLAGNNYAFKALDNTWMSHSALDSSWTVAASNFTFHSSVNADVLRYVTANNAWYWGAPFSGAVAWNGSSTPSAPSAGQFEAWGQNGYPFVMTSDGLTYDLTAPSRLTNGASFTNASGYGLTLNTATTNAAQIFSSNGTNATPSYSFSGETNVGMYHAGVGIIGFAANNSLRATISAVSGGGALVTSSSGAAYAVGAGSTAASADVGFTRDSAATTAFKNGANPQTNRIYGRDFGQTNGYFLEGGFDAGNQWFFLRMATNATGTTAGTNWDLVIGVTTNKLKSIVLSTNGLTVNPPQTNNAELFAPTNYANFNFLATNFIPSSSFSGTRYTNVNERGVLVVIFKFVDAVGGIPLANVVVEQNGSGGAKTNTWPCSIPGGLNTTVTNYYSFPVNPKAVVTITDASSGGASIGVVSSEILLQ